jgi:tetratricopeptide (TPR) repeat protein
MNSLEGDLSSTAFPQLLMSLHRQRLTGTLSVSADGMTKKIFFDRGDAIFSSSTFEDDRLGEMLVKSGKITVEQYDRSVELLKKTGKRQGAILVELGYLTPKDLFWGVKFQVREIIYSMFQFERGEYRFAAGDVPQDEVITLKMSMGNLIYEGVKRIDNWTRIRKDLPPSDAVLKLSDDPMSLFQEVEFTADDRKILSLVDGTRTIKQVVEDSWLNSFEAMKILYVLWSIGTVTEKKVEGAGVSLEELFRPAGEGEETLRKRVNEFYGRLPSMGSRQLLEVDEEATIEEIRRNYYRLAKEFHPDRFFDSDDQALRERLSAIFDAITDAYNSLKEGALKKEGVEAFDLSVGSNAARVARSPEAKRERASADEASAELKKGLDALRKGDMDAALARLDAAVRLDPSNAEGWSYLALALSKIPGRLPEAEKAMQRAIEIEPANAGYHANMGLLYLRGKASGRAREQFEKALSLDPDNRKAKQGLRQLGN